MYVPIICQLTIAAELEPKTQTTQLGWAVGLGNRWDVAVTFSVKLTFLEQELAFI